MQMLPGIHLLTMGCGCLAEDVWCVIKVLFILQFSTEEPLQSLKNNIIYLSLKFTKYIILFYRLFNVCVSSQSCLAKLFVSLCYLHSVFLKQDYSSSLAAWDNRQQRTDTTGGHSAM